MPIRLEPDPSHRPEIERRTAPRLDLISRIQGEVDTGDTVTLVKVSERGALVHSTYAAHAGEVHEFRFTPESAAAPLIFAATVVHVDRMNRPEGTVYALGLEFITGTDRQKQAVISLIAAAQRSI